MTLDFAYIRPNISSLKLNRICLFFSQFKRFTVTHRASVSQLITSAFISTHSVEYCVISCFTYNFIIVFRIVLPLQQGKTSSSIEIYFEQISQTTLHFRCLPFRPPSISANEAEGRASRAENCNTWAELKVGVASKVGVACSLAMAYRVTLIILHTLSAVRQTRELAK